MRHKKHISGVWGKLYPQKIWDNSNEVGVFGCIFLEWVKALEGVGVMSERWVLSKYIVLTY